MLALEVPNQRRMSRHEITDGFLIRQLIQSILLAVVTRALTIA